MTDVDTNIAITKIVGRDLPYVTSLDAMMIAETFLIKNEEELIVRTYRNNLLDIVRNIDLWYVRPAVKAQAYLRTYGKWKD